jgi:hypothetical protein
MPPEEAECAEDLERCPVASGPKGTVTRLPGLSCVHYTRGRCLYEEALNPGYHRSWRCTVLLGWESVYDEFLDRAERFALPETHLPDLWRRRFARLSEGEVDCAHYDPGSEEGVPECRQLHEELCLRLLPECAGQCRHYVLRVVD